jgi:ParB-like chromosome segregation protein Spo0J
MAEEDSLAENVQRAPLHPLDQFHAFQALRDTGLVLGVAEDALASQGPRSKNRYRLSVRRNGGRIRIEPVRAGDLRRAICGRTAHGRHR